MLVASDFSFSHSVFKRLVSQGHQKVSVFGNGLTSDKPLFNSLPNNKILFATKLKAFADDKLNVAKMLFSLFDRVENIVGKGENAGYQHFLLFPQCFPKPSSSGSLKSGLCCKGLNPFKKTISLSENP